MGKRQGSDIEVADREWSGDQPRFRDKVTLGPWSIVKGVSEYAAEIIHRDFVGVNGQCAAAAQIAKAAAIVESHDVVGVGMGKQDSIEPADILAQHLDAKLRGCIDDEFSLAGFDVDGWAGAMVFWVLEE